jgi:hypothetical protein
MKKNWTKRDINKTELQKNVIKMLKVSWKKNGTKRDIKQDTWSWSHISPL